MLSQMRKVIMSKKNNSSREANTNQESPKLIKYEELTLSGTFVHEKMFDLTENDFSQFFYLVTTYG
ncbi:hypothetical protein TanjilG_28267 [Lupinus angustifolius]|uniref:Uncharacterized protein n=1 Tax=Lupinus angustifolius TaxID=3871 RepID=A0A1J7FMH9_LUPAN|nr:hypothetical protein TanjilG_28267 [Lupinus angustifolius]